MKYYTGIGSRETPASVLALMTNIAMSLSDLGYTLRSGELLVLIQPLKKVLDNAELYIPWKGFCGKKNVVDPFHQVYVRGDDIYSRNIAEAISSTWNRNILRC